MTILSREQIDDYWSSLWEALAAVEDRERALHVALRDMCAEPSFGVGERRRILAALDGAG